MDIILKKGQSIQFLDYTIFNCENNDGLVLLSKKQDHCGNFGPGTEQDIDNAKQTALLYYMMRRQKIFKTCLLHKIMDGSGSGTCHEFYLLRDSLTADKLAMPEEITCEQSNGLIYYKNKPLQWLRK